MHRQLIIGRMQHSLAQNGEIAVDGGGVWLRPNGEVVRLPQREYDSQGQRTNRGMRLDENGVLTALHTTGEHVED